MRTRAANTHTHTHATHMHTRKEEGTGKTMLAAHELDYEKREKKRGSVYHHCTHTHIGEGSIGTFLPFPLVPFH